MRQKSNTPETPSERLVRDIRRATRKQYSAEEKIRIVLDGLRGEVTIAELCRREGIAESLYYSWSKEFLEAGKRRLAGDTARDVMTSGIHCCGEDDDLAKAAQHMEELKVRRLPVINKDKRMVGVLSRHDTARAQSTGRQN